MALVASIGTFTYNGFSFPTEHYVKISSRHVYDRAERAIIYTIHRLLVTATIAEDENDPAQTQDLSLSNIRKLLSRPGQSLVLTGHGFSNLIVNSAGLQGNVSDVAWGPKPRIVTWESLGPHAADVTWECEVAVADNSTADVLSTGPSASTFPRPAIGFLAFNYSAQFTIDRQGYTVRTISGYVEIPMTRTGGGATLPDCADKYWDTVFNTALIPTGFRRTTNQRRLDESKRVLEFVLVDEEMPSQYYLPQYVADCQASHSIDASDRTLLRYMATISASYTLFPGVQKSLSFAFFLDLVRKRQEALTANGATSFFPVAFHAEEPDIYGRAAANYRLTYSYFLSGIDNQSVANSKNDPANALPTSGLFRDVGTTYANWLNNNPTTKSRGRAGLQMLPSNDAIVSLADSQTLTMPVANSNISQDPWKNIATALGVTKPAPKTSYLFYNNMAEVVSKANVGAHWYNSLNFNWLSLLFPVIPPVTWDNTATKVASDAGDMDANSLLFQFRGQTMYIIRVVGSALRIGYKIPQPQINKFGGARAICVTGKFRCGPVANYGGVPLFSASWSITYAATAVPSTEDLQFLANPDTTTDLGNTTNSI